MEDGFASYAGQNLSAPRVRELAAQYEGVDMAALMGADHNNFPFLVSSPGRGTTIMIWNKPNGMIIHRAADPVRYYATVEYLREYMYPEFASLEEARIYAREHDWPLDELSL